MSVALPPLLVLTDGRHCGGRPLEEVVDAAVAGGARAVVLREKHLSRRERSRLADRLRPLLSAAGGVLLVASDPAIPADGLHLAVTDPWPASPAGLVGRSCHDARSLADAAEEGCSYATLSPIFATASKPGYGPPLGPQALAGAPLPVWALGGLHAANAAECTAAGATGVAVMGAIMTAADPAEAATSILRSLTGVARQPRPWRNRPL